MSLLKPILAIMLLAMFIVTPTLIIMPTLAQSSPDQTVTHESKDDTIITMAGLLCEIGGKSGQPFQSVCQGYDRTIQTSKPVVQKACQIYSQEGKQEDMQKIDQQAGFDVCSYVNGQSETNPQRESTTQTRRERESTAVVSQPPTQTAVGTQLSDYALIAMAVGAILIAVAVGALLMMRGRKAGPATLAQRGSASAPPQPQSTAQSGSSFCINCGKQIPMNSQFCKFCGSTQK